MMGENGEEAAAAVQEIQVAGPAVQAIWVVTETRNHKIQDRKIQTALLAGNWGLKQSET